MRIETRNGGYFHLPANVIDFYGGIIQSIKLSVPAGYPKNIKDKYGCDESYRQQKFER